VPLTSVLLHISAQIHAAPPSQKVLQQYPGFWSCVLVGTNQLLAEEEGDSPATVTASFLQYQVLASCFERGATIIITPDDWHITFPPQFIIVQPTELPVTVIAFVNGLVRNDPPGIKSIYELVKSPTLTSPPPKN
jgi:hypothetical protein